MSESSIDSSENGSVYGLMAEFDSPQELLTAAEKTHGAGYKEVDAFSPFPVEGLADAIGFHKNRVSLVVLIFGIIGCLSGYLLQYYVAVISYPINVGGRPLHSWPSFIIVTFELTILFGGISAAVGMFALNGLPLPYHPVFNVPAFSEASVHGLFLVVSASDPKYDAARTREFLKGLAPRAVSEVPS